MDKQQYEQYKTLVSNLDDSDVGSLSAFWNNIKQLISLYEENEKLKEALSSTNDELNFTIELYNKEVKDPSRFIDAETCFDNAKLLQEAHR
jgi:outer membrane protein TolC